MESSAAIMDECLVWMSKFKEFVSEQHTFLTVLLKQRKERWRLTKCFTFLLYSDFKSFCQLWNEPLKRLPPAKHIV